MKKALALVLAGAMSALTLAGCGSSASSTAAPAASAAASAPASSAAADSGRPAYVRDASEVTGTLTVYTTMEETQQDVLKEIWSKYYPDCDIEIVADSVGTLATKIRGDESCEADVVIGGMFAADGDKYHDILQPYTAACDAEQLYHDASGYYTFYDVQVMCLVVNPELCKELGVTVTGYQDLLQPELKGKIITADPSASSSGWRQVQTILATMGDKFDDDKGWDYMAELLPQCIQTDSSKDVYNLVINGEYAVGLSYESTVAALINDGAPVECIYMTEGNTAMPGGAAIVKDAPNLTAAEAMMDILSSAEFQNARAEQSSGRGSNGECESSALPDESTLNMVELDYDYLNTNKDAMLEKYADLWASVNG